MKIFLDLDGVLANFVKAMCFAHSQPDPYLNKESLGKFDMLPLMDLPVSEFWSPANTIEFWADMERLPDADAILEIVLDFVPAHEICLLTSPSPSPLSAAGKLLWIQRNYPSFSRRIMISAAKHFVAHENSLLIDDRDQNCNEFRDEGGQAILLPRPWNSNHAIATLHHLNAELKAAFYKKSAIYPVPALPQGV